MDDRPLITTEFERVLDKRGVWSLEKFRYASQKEHWIGWLREYDGPGYYGRKNFRRSAEFAYNHIVCPPMVLWLGEASGVPKKKVLAAKQAALTARPALQSLSAAIREVIPWEDVEGCLRKKS
jgi:hypothetical protein